MPGSSFLTQPIPQGVNGLQLNKALDAMLPGELSRWSNMVHTTGGSAQVRPGYSVLQTTPGGEIHSLGRLNAQVGGISYARFAGVDGTVRSYQSGGGTGIITGFSGNPVTFCPHQTKAGGTWMYIGDSAKVRKVSIDGLDFGIGLPAPVSAPTAVLATEQKTTIEQFEGGFTGYGDAGTGGGVPTLAYPAGKVNLCLEMTTNPGTATQGYINFADKAVSVDLSRVGSRDSSDSDFIHIWLKATVTNKIAAIRVYLVTSPFTSGTIPGTSAVSNVDAWMHEFQPSQLTAIISEVTVEDAAFNAVTNKLIQLGVEPPLRTTTLKLGLGQWTEFGPVSGYALAKSDFQAIGSPDWSTVQGILVWVMTTDTDAVEVFFDDCYLTGGYGLDSVTSGTQPYDWVYTNYNLLTEEESNYSPTMPTTIDSARRAVNVTPAAVGSAYVRQRFYRRGGTQNDDWWYDGQNGVDGGVYQSTESDDTVFGTGIAAPNNHNQLVTTQDSTGNTILAQPLPVIFGPLNGMLLALGDPYRPGYLYNSIPNEPDHWPAGNATEVCSGTEALQGGVMFGTQAFVFSTERGYIVLPNVSGDGTVTVVPSGCEHGLASRWGIATGLGAIFIVSTDGIYATQGQGEGLPISDDIRPLFYGDPTYGRLPIDFSHPEDIKLAVVTNDLWFGYRDTAGVKQWMIYSLLYKFWRPYSFADEQSVVYQEDGVIPASILYGGRFSGNIYQQGGLTDAGVGISWSLRTGTLNQGNPRAVKRYGEVALDIDLAGGSGSLTAYLDDETIVYGPISTGSWYQESGATGSFSGRKRVYVDPFAGAVIRARNFGLELSGQSTTGTPEIWLGEYAFDSEPIDYTSWGTGELTFGVPAWKRLLELHLTYRAVAEVTLRVQAYNESGAVVKSFNLTLPASSAQRTVFLPCPPNKGFTYDFLATADGPFRIYGGESVARVAALNAAQSLRIPLLATDGGGAEGGGAVNPLLAARRAGGMV